MPDNSHDLVHQRIRNRIIETLEMFFDTDSIEEIGTDEIINLFYDYVDKNSFVSYSQPVFSEIELSSLWSFYTLLESLYKKIPSTWSKSDLYENNAWTVLQREADSVYKIFMERGYLSEDKNEFPSTTEFNK